MKVHFSVASDRQPRAYVASYFLDTYINNRIIIIHARFTHVLSGYSCFYHPNKWSISDNPPNVNATVTFQLHVYVLIIIVMQPKT